MKERKINNEQALIQDNYDMFRSMVQNAENVTDDHSDPDSDLNKMYL